MKPVRHSASYLANIFKSDLLNYEPADHLYHYLKPAPPIPAIPDVTRRPMAVAKADKWLPNIQSSTASA
jgi:hypothetical protein